ncbi:hypothetical protein [uncultured Prevotella sp.]|uniref:hypothetical protein n=1 Tax=uncultured Prevotella sp. TaxID=159272 RepID=UPI0026DDAF98|nr:hypothetical protein [uncultured Prevotella sp.]
MNKIFIAAIATAFTLASCSSEGDGPEGPRSQQILGHIEKGPFVQGSEVTLTDLNKDLSQSGKSYTTNTTSDLGSFDFGQTLDLSSGLVELKTSGYFYNECTGSLSNSQITLKAIANTDGAANLNVNLLTHLEYARVKYLVKSGKSFKQAKEQAESEILKSFAITDKIASPEKVSLTDCDKNANILLAISSIMLYDKSEVEFSEFIAKFSNDIEKDGTIDNSQLKETIKKGQENCHPSQIKKKMEEYYQSKGSNVAIGNFSQFIDFNGDGVIDDKDEETLDVVNPGTSTEETFFKSEKEASYVLNSIYAGLHDYITYQNQLDAMRLYNDKVQQITSNYGIVSNAWNTGYNIDARARQFIYILENHEFSFDTKGYLTTAKALRTLLLYNMAMEWGRIPVINGYDTSGAIYAEQSDAETVYNTCLKELSEVQIPEYKNMEKVYFRQKAVDVLKAEIYLALGKKDEAKQILNTIPSGDVFVLSRITAEDKDIDIYSADYIKYLKEEANGKDNSAEWFVNRRTNYGTFAALRRLDKVQSLTNIDSHFNLLPIPAHEILANPKLTQNTGY